MSQRWPEVEGRWSAAGVVASVLSCVCGYGGVGMRLVVWSGVAVLVVAARGRDDGVNGVGYEGEICSGLREELIVSCYALLRPRLS